MEEWLAYQMKVEEEYQGFQDKLDAAQTAVAINLSDKLSAQVWLWSVIEKPKVIVLVFGLNTIKTDSRT